MDELSQFRKDKDKLFAKEEQSPLTQEQKNTFSGLKYYEPNPSLIFTDLEIQKAETDEVIDIPTSTGDTQPHKRVGQIEFDVGGNSCRLTIFENTQGGQLFLPFKDQTNESETYHDGRYIEIELDNGKLPELDFNYAYNPYCAYNERWRCPKTPSENELSVEIKAGEKRFG